MTFFVVFVLIFLSFLSISKANQVFGFSISGAGGRIAQEVALIESLLEGTYQNGTKIIPQVVSGASSGSLCLVAVNAILDPNNTYTVENFKQDIFTIQPSDVYDDSIEGIAEIPINVVVEGYILNTDPLQQYLQNLLDRVNYRTLGDLPLHSYISVVNATSGDTQRLDSHDPEHKKLSLLEVLMSTTAMPIVFPKRKITPYENYWLDGGTAEDDIPLYSLLQDPEVTDIVIIARQQPKHAIHSDPPFPLNDFLILKEALFFFDEMRRGLDECILKDTKDLKKPVYKFIPTLGESWSVLDFSEMELQYNLTRDWTQTHFPVL